MKLTKSQLKQLIKEELSQLLESDRYPSDDEPVDWLEDRRFARDDNTQGGASNAGPGLDRYETEQITHEDMDDLQGIVTRYMTSGTLVREDTGLFKSLLAKLAKIVS
jgi:hypothetical protein